MSLLSIIQNACGQIGLPSPSVVMSNTDDQIRILRTLANVEGRDLAARYQWQVLQTTATVNCVAAEDQGLITTLAPGFKRFISWTQWNIDSIRPVPNMTPQDYAAMKATNITGPFPEFRLRQNHLIMFPIPTAGHTVTFEYITKNWVTSADGSSSYETFQADTDVSLLDEFIIEQGVRWRFLKQKNADYTEEFRTYETLVANAMSRDGDKPTLDAGNIWPRRGIFVPEGSWPITP